MTTNDGNDVQGTGSSTRETPVGYLLFGRGASCVQELSDLIDLVTLKSPELDKFPGSIPDTIN